MTTTPLTHEHHEATPASLGLGVTSMDEVAETIRDESLAAARERLGLSKQSLDLAELLRRPDFFDRFKHGLASAISRTLGANDNRVQVIYTYEPSANPDSETGVELPPDAVVHLLVLVTKPSAALEAFIAALDRAVTMSLKALPAAPFAQCESVLDVQVVTEKDVRLGLGYAAMLSSVFTPPLKVWQREV